jgi:methionine-gamma-lyase
MIAGAILGSKDFISSLVDVNHGAVMLTGPVMDPRIAHELYLRLDHLPLRMKAHSEAALHLAQAAEKQGLKVFYPGLKSHSQHELFMELSNREIGAGGMVTLDCGDRPKALRLASRLQAEKFGLYAVSLGFSRTLMSCPSVSTSSEIPEDKQAEMGLSPGLLRLSIGFTGPNEVMTERFLRACREVL